MIEKHVLKTILKKAKEPLYRAEQVLHAVYKEGKGDYGKIVVLPQNVRDLLAKEAPVFSFVVEKEVESESGDTVKTVFKMADAVFVEGVLMRFKDGRNSVCVSSQVGCGLKCVFCATGKMGFKRNLAVQEIADQVLYFDQMLKASSRFPKGHVEARVSHVVFMGMGEPFLNYEEVIKAIRILNDPDCLGIAARNITVSTAGIIPGIEKLSREKMQVNLAVSLHAESQELREKLMPIAKSYKLPSLIAAVSAYIRNTHRRVSYEYVMMNGINDSANHALGLAKLLRGQLCHVNLIPYNETYLGFRSSRKPQINRFREILESCKIPVTVRVSLGQNINAACGQLAAICCTPCNLH